MLELRNEWWMGIMGYTSDKGRGGSLKVDCITAITGSGDQYKRQAGRQQSYILKGSKFGTPFDPFLPKTTRVHQTHKIESKWSCVNDVNKVYFVVVVAVIIHG